MLIFRVLRVHVIGLESLDRVELVMNELRRFKHSADVLAISSHIIESAAISAS